MRQIGDVMNKFGICAGFIILEEKVVYSLNKNERKKIN